MVGSNAKKRPRPQEHKCQHEDEESSLILDAEDSGKDIHNCGNTAQLGAGESESSITVSNEASSENIRQTNPADRRKAQKTHHLNIDLSADKMAKTKAQGGAQLDKKICGLANNTFYIQQVRQRKPPAGTERKAAPSQGYLPEKGEQQSQARKGNLKNRGKSMVAGKTVGLSQDLQQRIVRK